MVATDRVRETFADAYGMYDDSLERLSAGDIRDAAEKAWCATLRATNALILARTGEEPLTTPGTSRRLDRIACHDSGAKSLVGRYYSRQSHLHGDCFYSGMLDESEEIERHIRKTIDYITDAESLVDTDAAQ